MCQRDSRSSDISCRNNVLSKEKAKRTAESIVCLAKEVKASNFEVSISSIIPRNHNCNKKIMEVNYYLKDFFESNYIPFISNPTINPKKHLNNNRLHLNPKGCNKLRDNFVRYLKVLNSWENDKGNWPLGCSGSQDNACSSSRVTKISKKKLNSKHLSFLRKTFKSHKH